MPREALLLLAATFCLLAAMYVVCYTFFMASWEGWEAWNRRTGLDAEMAEDAWSVGCSVTSIQRPERAS